ncbi:MAG: fumarylacetoacetate hydrolase family protein, partial [FCB group bacterium]|nr:fumarylacetoacetate hydrolase family protein [FCB group bacterium]
KKGDYIVDVLRAAIWAKTNRNQSEFLEIPTSLKRALANWNHILPQLQRLIEIIPDTNLNSYTANERPLAFKESDVILLPPVPDPATFRDFNAFEKHMLAMRRQQGFKTDALWYQIPVFYYSNPCTFYGHRAEIPYPAGTNELDFELEWAVIIANGGKNITREEADLVIGGFTILNDWSARDWQREEMRLNLGPAKGKDFATSAGPYLVTPDELADRKNGQQFDLNMTCRVNGNLLSSGNTGDLYHSFAAMIERASRNTPLLPGDYIGSGTVGSGCILELGPENTGGWLKPGDLVTMNVERLGTLENRIV